MTPGAQTITLRLDSLSKSLQHRLTDATDADLDRLVTAYKLNPDAVPPIKVYASGVGAYDVVGGHLRFEAARRAGLTYVRAIVLDRPDTDDEILWESYLDNATHGRPPTVEERREMARVLRQIHPKMAATAISERVGLARHTVESAIRPKPTDKKTRSSSSASVVKRFLSTWQTIESGDCDIADLSPELEKTFWDTVARIAQIADDG